MTMLKFDGAYFFAGHEDATVPGRQSRDTVPAQDSGGGGSVSQEELEAKLAGVEAQAQEREMEDARMAAASDMENHRVAVREFAYARAAGSFEVARIQERAGELHGASPARARIIDAWDGRRCISEGTHTLKRESEDARSKS
jgi:hypothetical protein